MPLTRVVVCFRHLSAVVVGVLAGVFGGLARRLLLPEFLRVEGDSRLLPYLSVQCGDARPRLTP